MSKLYDVVGSNKPDFLLADPQGTDKVAIPVEPGNGTVKRGTVMYRKAIGMYAPAAAANVVATNDLVVIDEEVDTTANATIAENAAAYRAGRLLAGKVVLSDGTAVTAAMALVLRQQGIVLDQFDDWSGDANEFNNVK